MNVKVAILWRGDAQARSVASPENNRFHQVFEAFAALHVLAERAVFADDTAAALRPQLLAVDAVLAWVDPIHQGQTRTVLDALLRDVASHGILASAHPDVILKMGVKEVLYRTKHLGWGVDTRLYRTADEFASAFPARLETSGPRVLKQNRGNGGQGVWKVEQLAGEVVRVLHARRGSLPEDVTLSDFMARCATYFTPDGCIVDQPFQPRLPDGMIRCYMTGDRVIGFGHQLITVLIPPPPAGPEAALPGPRIMHPASAERFWALRALMETAWVPQMMTVLGIDAGSLPIIWDADFLVRTPRCGRCGHVCAVRDQCEFGFPGPGRCAGSNCAADAGARAGWTLVWRSLRLTVRVA